MAFSGKSVPQARLPHGYTDRHASSKHSNAWNGIKISRRKKKCWIVNFGTITE